MKPGFNKSSLGIVLAALVILIQLTGTGRCESSDLSVLRDMAVLDRAYIPAFVYASDGDTVRAAKAMDAVSREWERFKALHSEDKPADKRWSMSIAEIDSLVSLADESFTNGKTVIAKGAIEEMGRLLYKMRERNNMRYFLDPLADCHDPIESIYLIVVNKTPETLYGKSLEMVEEYTAQVIDLWSFVSYRNRDNRIFLLDQERKDNLNRLLKEEGSVLVGLERALFDDDIDAVMDNAIMLRKRYREIYMIFGDFK